MADPTLLIALASAGTAGIAISAAAGLKAWEEWLDLRRTEISGRNPRKTNGAPLELGELRERVRRLEAIANGAAR